MTAIVTGALGLALKIRLPVSGKDRRRQPTANADLVQDTCRAPRRALRPKEPSANTAAAATKDEHLRDAGSGPKSSAPRGGGTLRERPGPLPTPAAPTDLFRALLLFRSDRAPATSAGRRPPPHPPPTDTSSTTARCRPNCRAHTLVPRTSFIAPLDSDRQEAGNVGAERRARHLRPSTHPRKRHKSPFSQAPDGFS